MTDLDVVGTRKSIVLILPLPMRIACPIWYVTHLIVKVLSNLTFKVDKVLKPSDQAPTRVMAVPVPVKSCTVCL
jgi:hypothetical protein